MKRLATYSVNSEILKILIQTANYRQGSIVALVKQSGTVSERYSYDAWGRRRNPANWADYNVPAPRLIARGYTGHEHLDGFGLINMNGRMYDPVIGRVLSPDNFIQDPTNTQSYNRYSYCLNNPLRYTDPSGWLTSAGWAEYYENKANSEFAFLESVGFRSNPSYSDNGGGGGSSGISWTDYLHDPRENFVMMSSKAYDQMYGPGKYVKMQAARRNSDFCGPDKYGVYSKGSIVTNRFGKWFFTSEHGYVQIEDYTLLENVPQGKGNGNPSSGEGGNEHLSPMEIGFKINDAADKAGTLTGGTIYGAQKVAGVAAKDMAKLTAMTIVGRVTGVTCVVDNSMKFWENPRANWWNGVEALGQATAITVGWATGIEEIELIYNTTTLTIDLTKMAVDKYKQDHP